MPWKRLLAASILFASCSMSEGTIVNKYIEPANHYYAWVPIQTGNICTSVGTSVSCTPIFTPFPFLMYDDEDYAIVLQDKKGKRGRRDLTPSEYAKWQVGDYWTAKQSQAITDTDSRTRKADPSEMPPSP